MSAIAWEIVLATVLAILAAIVVDWWRKPPGGSGQTPGRGSKGFKFSVELEKK